MVRDIDLILVGRIVDLYIGEYWRGNEYEKPSPLAYAKVAIEDRLLGEPRSREPGFIEVQMGYAPNDLDELRAHLPAHDHLWFLNYEDADGRSEFNQSDIVAFVYYAYQDVSTIFREINGVVEVFAPDRISEAYGRDEFVLTIDGTDFESFVERVRDEVRDSARVPIALARTSNEAHPETNRYAAC